MFPTQPEQASAPSMLFPLILTTMEDVFLISTLQMRQWSFREATHSGSRPERGPRTLCLSIVRLALEITGWPSGGNTLSPEV